MQNAFSAAIVLTPGEGGFVGQVTADWSQGRAAFGGLLSGMMLSAAETLVPALPLRSVLMDFLAPAADGPVQLVPTLLRVGRTMSRVEVKLWQEETLCAVMMAAFGPARATALELSGTSAPPVSPQEPVTPMPFIEGIIPRFTRQFDYRHIGGRYPYTGQSSPGVGGWVRIRDTAPVSPAGVLALIDAWPSPALPLLSRPAPASTVTWMVNLPAGPVSAPAEAWWRFEADVVSSSGGFTDTDGKLWAPDGTLVATSRQLVAEFSKR